jgi:DNA-directed RNA polymerase II subunit RPB1
MSNFDYVILTKFLSFIRNEITLKGISNIENTTLTEERYLDFDKETGDEKVIKEKMIITNGVNYEKIKFFKGIDLTRTFCNDIYVIYQLYGIEAARSTLYNELITTFNAGGSGDINYNHMAILIDFMTATGNIVSIDRHGLEKINQDPLSKAAFEKTMDHLINASIFNEKDKIKTVSSRIMLGQVINGGTGCFDLYLDTDKIANSELTQDEMGGRSTFTGLEDEAILQDIVEYGINNTDFFIPTK